MNYLFTLILASLLLAAGLPGQAQQKSKKKRKGATTTTSYNARIKPPKAAREYLHLYQPNTRGTLVGNHCMDEYTEKMGFRYLVMPAGMDDAPSPTQMRLHNFGVKCVLLVRNGPFWHHRVNKRVRKCREKTGDYAG
ncbi:hypothetical protein [Cesiribacter andamanensis]|uniref:Uncharacterized protein n=1 Tax=Cesiribacter andamanensis AMV16 TaxID=1279009 RepID=M7NBK5_9BACT|nr:hypothetical protein [Cesiribacter andamanensis]EMR04571.1 hypothetical protein ADICEAN_00329 [Cesiribacter andamanensis AMV16]